MIDTASFVLGAAAMATLDIVVDSVVVPFVKGYRQRGRQLRAERVHAFMATVRRPSHEARRAPKGGAGDD